MGWDLHLRPTLALQRPLRTKTDSSMRRVPAGSFNSNLTGGLILGIAEDAG